MNRNKIYILTTALMGFPATGSNAQEISLKNYYSFDRIEERTPWLRSSNGAGLIYNDAAYNFSTAEAYYNNVSGDFRNYNQPSAINNLGAATRSYVRIGDLYFYGNFNYDYTIGKDQAWLGTTYENTILNPVADSIPGKVLREAYILNAKVAYRFSPVFSAGVAFDYRDATANKRKDGRNKNTYSDLRISPGISFSTGHVNAGVSFTYRHNAEDVDYKYYGETASKNIYYMEGLFMYAATPITTSTLLERRYDKNIFGGGLQLELKWGNFSFYNSFTADYGHEYDYEDLLRKRYAKVNTLDYRYEGELKYVSPVMDNSLRIKYSSEEAFSYFVINNYEPIPDELNQWGYFEYGSVLRYTSWVKSLGAEYRGFIKKNEYLPKWDFTIGFDYAETDKTEKIFPAEYRQNARIRNYYAQAGKSFAAGRSIIRLDLNGGFSGGDGTPLMQSQPLEGGELKLNLSLLAYDYAYRYSDRFRVGGGIRYSFMVNPQKGRTLYLGADYLYKKLSGIDSGVYEICPQFGALEKSGRNHVQISFGYNF